MNDLVKNWCSEVSGVPHLDGGVVTRCDNILIDLVPSNVAGESRGLVGHGWLDTPGSGALVGGGHTKVPHIECLADGGGGQKVLDPPTPVDVYHLVAIVVESRHRIFKALHIVHLNL